MSSPRALSEAEKRFDLVRRRTGLVLAPVVFFGLLWAPLGSLDPLAQRMAAIGGLTIVLWITEAIPLATAGLLGPALAVLIGVAPAKQAFAAFAHPLIFLFMGGFMLAAALSRQGFDRRTALWIIGRPRISGSPARAVIALAVVAFAFSMWISNTATTAMLLPVALGLHATLSSSMEAGPDERRALGTGMVLTLAYASSLGGMATPIGTAPNVIALSLLESKRATPIDFVGWMSFALPISIALLVVTLVVVRRKFPLPATAPPRLGEEVRRQLEAMGPLSVGERRTLAVFGLAIAGWIAPSVLRIVLGTEHPIHDWATQGLDEGVVAILSASLLFFLPSGPTSKTAEGTTPRLLTWEDAQALDWGTLLLLGGGMALGHLAFDTGLAKALGHGVLDLGGPLVAHPWGLMAVCALLVLLLTEVSSNTATTSMMLPVLIAIAEASGQDPVPPAIATTLAASCAFMLPVSTPPNAIAYGSGMVRLHDMLTTGWWLDVLAYGILLVGAGLLLPFVLG